MVAIKLDDVANGVYSSDDEMGSTESPHLTTFTLAPNFNDTPAEYADGQTFASVLAPLSLHWSVLPPIAMICFLFLRFLWKRCKSVTTAKKQPKTNQKAHLEPQPDVEQCLGLQNTRNSVFVDPEAGEEVSASKL